ncbi:MAG: 50S ribosomal protein L37e [Candidatus Aenigmarchaeota archaeon ex4484_224]|nr:MAG: 50S ribosomal protein L37e [Candidatus Aenigmarchaeota archaeon ex4484_224]
MVKGTPSMGKKNKVIFIRCRRCGHVSYRIDKKYCTHCGYGRSKKLRKYNWRRKKK